jgi:hypothetical protein
VGLAGVALGGTGVLNRLDVGMSLGVDVDAAMQAMMVKTAKSIQ